jgi:hypothetical protein
MHLGDVKPVLPIAAGMRRDSGQAKNAVFTGRIAIA